MEIPAKICPKCKFPILDEHYFCPNCGKQLRQKEIDVSIIKQIGVYLLSFFLPPFGLYPGIRFLLYGDSKTKIVGFIAIILTIISVFITFYIFNSFMQEYSKTLNQLGNGQLSVF